MTALSWNCLMLVFHHSIPDPWSNIQFQCFRVWARKKLRDRYGTPFCFANFALQCGNPKELADFMQSQRVRNSSGRHNPCCLDSSTCDVAYAEACSACASYEIWAGANCDVATSDSNKSCLGALPKTCVSHLRENCVCKIVEDDATLHLEGMSCCEPWNVWVPASGEASRCLHTSSSCHVSRGSIVICN